MSDGLRVEAVLFDIDGTLIDSNDARAQSWTQALGEHGIAVDVEYIRRLVGMGGDKLLPLVARVSEESEVGRAVAKRKQAIFGTLPPDLEPTPGARNLVAYLLGVTSGVKALSLVGAIPSVHAIARCQHETHGEDTTGERHFRTPY